ncbi:MAG TPA: acyl-CoA dehydrogenase family protein [Pyrinomonadaceae bacterium]|nr:acyl-CoA dehydrogenase family protein [Pyrinomonadaceae bacterium]
MRVELSEAQREARLRFRRFVQENISPHAAEWDREERIPPELVARLREQGYLGAPVPAEAGGGGMGAITYGLLTEEMARGCSSVRSLLTVHDMVSLAVLRWAGPELKDWFRQATAGGGALCALALSEPEAGSDAAGVRTEARRDGDDYVLDGRKKWITFGQIANLFLALARYDGKLTAFLVPADARGVTRRPIGGVVGTRASMLAEVEFKGCRVPASNLVGKTGFGLSHVMGTALDQGRYSVAWGAVGIAQACLDACLEYTSAREQFGVRLSEHQLVRRKLTNMITDARAARLLCYRAGHLRQAGDPGAGSETLVAKYFASRAAVRAANDAVQLHGANGLTDAYPVARYLRDARVTEIIEGSTQIQQISIARTPLAEL